MRIPRLYLGDAMLALSWRGLRRPHRSQCADRRRADASAPPSLAATSPANRGPEAGVWVIAETMTAPTNTAKIVAPPDRRSGSLHDPETPKAQYKVWTCAAMSS